MEENKNTLEVQETLDIWRFTGTTLPKEFLDFFPNLKHLNLGNYPQLRLLPDGFLDKCSQLERLDLCNNQALWSDPDDTKNREEILQRLLINKVWVDLEGSPHAERIYKNLAAKQIQKIFRDHHVHMIERRQNAAKRIQKVFRGYRVRKKLTAKK